MLSCALRAAPGVVVTATVGLLLAASPALTFELSYAQTSVVALVCFTMAFFALRADRPFLAGLAIGTLVYKPQLGLVAADDELGRKLQDAMLPGPKRLSR